MQKHELFRYFWFGTCLRYLQDARRGMSLGSGEDGNVRFDLTRLLKLLDDYSLPVSARAATGLRVRR